MYQIKFTNSKRVKQAYQEYLNSNAYRLSECYTTCSYAKQQAEQDILYYLTQCTEEYIKPYKIISFSTMTFSCGAVVQLNGRKVFLYFTYCNTYGMYLD